MTPKAPDAKPDAADQDTVTLDGLRDQFFVATRACERFAKEVGAIAQKLQDAKADDPWLTEVRHHQAQPSPHAYCSRVLASGGPPQKTPAFGVAHVLAEQSTSGSYQSGQTSGYLLS